MQTRQHDAWFTSSQTEGCRKYMNAILFWSSAMDTQDWWQKTKEWQDTTTPSLWHMVGDDTSQPEQGQSVVVWCLYSYASSGTEHKTSWWRTHVQPQLYMLCCRLFSLTSSDGRNKRFLISLWLLVGNALLGQLRLWWWEICNSILY